MKGEGFRGMALNMSERICRDGQAIFCENAYKKRVEQKGNNGRGRHFCAGADKNLGGGLQKLRVKN